MNTLSAQWKCCLKGMFISAQGLTSTLMPTRSPRERKGPNLSWQTNGWVDKGPFTPGRAYTYSLSGFIASNAATIVVPCNCPLAAGNFLNRYPFPSISEVAESDQSMSLGEYQLVVPRYAAVDVYFHDDASILDGGWIHANTLSPPDGDIKGQAIGAWLFQGSISTLSVIAREGSSQGGSDFLVGYEVILDRRIQKEKAWVGPVRLVADNVLIDGVDGSAPFLLTNFDEENRFHLLVPREDEVSRVSRIEHYTQERSILGQWTHVTTLQPPSDIPGTKITAVNFVQSSQGKFEAIARVTPPDQEDNYLVGYELDVVNNPWDWSPPFRLFTNTGLINVTGSPILLESDFGEENRFHLLAPTKADTIHYTQAVDSFSQGQWQPFATLNSFHNLPVTAVTLVENQFGGFEAVTRVQGPEGDEIVVGYELQPGATQWSDGVALNADDGPILAGKPTPPVDELPTKPIG